MSQKQDEIKRRSTLQRTQADAKLATVPPSAVSAHTVDELLHELQVHQIELQMQNEELRATQLELEESRNRYLDLYEFAPVGYLTLGRDGLILQINLTGALLLGQDRKKVLQRPFSRFVSAEDCDQYHRRLGQIMKHDGRQSFAVKLKRLDGGIVHVQLDCVQVVDDDIRSAIRVTLTDISEQRRAEAEVANLAFYDSLTQLPNRRLLLDRLRQLLATSSRTRRYGAILFIDLDDFKTLNDTQGHDIGDLLLRRVSQRLTTCVREGDTVSRLGGDEFVVMLEALSEYDTEAVVQTRTVAQKILANLKEPYDLAGYSYRSSGSIGITLFKGDGESVEDLLKRADLALYRAKAAGQGILRFFDPEMQAAVTARAVLESDLRRAFEEGQFVLHYQPQMDDQGRMISAEALVRWQHPDRGLLFPDEFIPFAEGKGLIEPLGQWVMETVCAQLVAWSSSPDTTHLTLAMNISAHEFCHPEFVTRTLNVIDRTGADSKKLILEFTESAMIGCLEETHAKMTALRARGVRFALDDFGVGYSSLAYLKYLSLDQLKIDRSFVRDVHTNPVDAAIARSIITLGQSLGLIITVEGVETEEQRSFFTFHGCRSFQGFLFGMPCPLEDLFPKIKLTPTTECRFPL
jgi:diguanylate cyclase (GGDEF)-like protein/PAS domain S-box-containing protein